MLTTANDELKNKIFTPIGHVKTTYNTELPPIDEVRVLRVQGEQEYAYSNPVEVKIMKLKPGYKYARRNGGSVGGYYGSTNLQEQRKNLKVGDTFFANLKSFREVREENFSKRTTSRTTGKVISRTDSIFNGINKSVQLLMLKRFKNK